MEANIIINCDSKILTKISANRLNNKIANLISANQYGFMKNKNIATNINLITNTLLQKQSNGSLCFLNQEKAYDRVDWKYLTKCLSYFKIDNKFIQWNTLYLKSCSFRVLGNNFITNNIISNRGLRQGDPISPILYNISIYFISFLSNVPLLLDSKFNMATQINEK